MSLSQAFRPMRRKSLGEKGRGGECGSAATWAVQLHSRSESPRKPQWQACGSLHQESPTDQTGLQNRNSPGNSVNSRIFPRSRHSRRPPAPAPSRTRFISERCCGEARRDPLHHLEPGYGWTVDLRYIPGIIASRGCNPIPCPDDVMEKLAWYKQVNGLTLEELGAEMGRDADQLREGLSGRRKPCRRNREEIERFLKASTGLTTQQPGLRCGVGARARG